MDTDEYTDWIVESIIQAVPEPVVNWVNHWSQKVSDWYDPPSSQIRIDLTRFKHPSIEFTGEINLRDILDRTLTQVNSTSHSNLRIIIISQPFQQEPPELRSLKLIDYWTHPNQRRVLLYSSPRLVIQQWLVDAQNSPENFRFVRDMIILGE